jgi:hypothetical protein
MAQETLLLDALFQVVTGVVYAYVGRVTARRRVEGEGKLAADLFALWWYALGAITASGAITRVLAWSGVRDVGIFAAVTHVSLLVLCVALWALLYYLVYLFTGNRRWLVPLSAFYVVYYLAMLYYVVLRQPIGVTVTDWAVKLEYANPAPVVSTAVIVLLLIVPPLVGAAGYARLFWRVTEPTQRYRIGMVSFTLLGWFGSALGAYGTGISTDPWWQAVSRLIGLAAALLIYAAYRPPGWVQRRWGVRSIEAEAS